MAIAALQGVEHEFGKLTLLRGVDLELSQGERVALVGPNGSGKTTLFNILARQMKPTHGTVFWAKGLTISHLEQQPRLEGDSTVRQAARKPFQPLLDLQREMHELSEELSRASGDELGKRMKEYGQLEARLATAGGFAWEHRVEEVLSGVGFTPDQCELPCRVLSGGQQGRLALACVLLSGADLLLLDEPTNHLDFQAVNWLEKFLAPLPAGVLMVSHDRYFLDRLATKVYELADGLTKPFPGNYSSYAQQRQARLLEQERQAEKDRAYIAKERDFIARFHASGSRSREARGRKTRLERRLKAGEFVTETTREQSAMRLPAVTGTRGSDLALRVREVSKGYGDRRLIENLSLDLLRGQKLAVLGPNGVGKTTLLRMALGSEKPDHGTVRIGAGMTVGYYDQRQTGLDDGLTVLEQMRAFAGGLDDRAARGFLARFLFTAEEVYKRIRVLSGGERSRLLLARLFHSQPNFLILDEPTNHLDIPSREMLEEALGEYAGTVLLVSHDRYLVDRVCGRTLLLEEGRWELVEGNYTYWRQLQEERAVKARQAAEGPAPTRGQKRGTPKGHPGGRASSTKVGGLNSYQLARLTLDAVEDQIHQAERRLGDIERSFSDPAVFSDARKLASAQQKYDRTRGEIDLLMEVWQAKIDEQ